MRQVSLAGAILCLLLGGIGVLGYVRMSGLDAVNSQNRDLTLALRYHLERDMMHDAMRTQVLAAYRASLNGNVDEKRQVRGEAEYYTKWLDRSARDLEALPLPDEIKAKVIQSNQGFAQYKALVDKAIDLTLQDPQWLDRNWEMFDTAFSKLERDNQRLSDTI